LGVWFGSAKRIESARRTPSHITALPQAWRSAWLRRCGRSLADPEVTSRIQSVASGFPITPGKRGSETAEPMSGRNPPPRPRGAYHSSWLAVVPMCPANGTLVGGRTLEGAGRSASRRRHDRSAGCASCAAGRAPGAGPGLRTRTCGTATDPFCGYAHAWGYDFGRESQKTARPVVRRLWPGATEGGRIRRLLGFVRAMTFPMAADRDQSSDWGDIRQIDVTRASRE
jgi:hypothetical protein